MYLCSQNMHNNDDEQIDCVFIEHKDNLTVKSHHNVNGFKSVLLSIYYFFLQITLCLKQNKNTWTQKVKVL